MISVSKKLLAIAVVGESQIVTVKLQFSFLYGLEIFNH